MPRELDDTINPCDYRTIVSAFRGLFEIKFQWDKRKKLYTAFVDEFSNSMTGVSLEHTFFQIRDLISRILHVRPDYKPLLGRGLMKKPLEKFYLSGPMSGREELNKKAFIDTATAFRNYNLEVFSPYDYSKAIALGEGVVKNSRRYLLNSDMAAICLWADAIVMLPEWETSRGARAELYTALALDLPVLFSDDLIPTDFACLKNMGVDGRLIASMLLGEKVNDFDIYFKDCDVALEVSKYYMKMYETDDDENPFPIPDNNTHKSENNDRVLISTPNEEYIMVSRKCLDEEANYKPCAITSNAK